jgi:DNA-binding MarR family transcriptional regulator
MSADYQQDLFGHRAGRQGAAFARGSDPDTSHQAAEHVQRHTATRLERLALAAVRANPAGLTNHEIAAVTGVVWNTITPRMKPLERKGLVYDSGLRRKGPTNRPCIVWRPT